MQIDKSSSSASSRSRSRASTINPGKLTQRAIRGGLSEP